MTDLGIRSTGGALRHHGASVVTQLSLLALLPALLGTCTLTAPTSVSLLADVPLAQPDPATIAVARFFHERPSGMSHAEIAELAPVLVVAAHTAGVSPAVLLALIHVESSGNVAARSRAGALGLMQLLPGTGQAVAQELGIEWTGPETLLDARANVKLGAAYLSHLIERFGNLETALAAYNWGPTRIARFLRRGQAVPAVYKNRVIERYRRGPHLESRRA